MTGARKIKIEYSEELRSSEITVGFGLLESAGEWISGLAAKPSKLAVISNPKVYGLYGSQLMASLDAAGYRASDILVPDGEEYKTLETASTVLAELNKSRISREDAIISLGGGVVGDLAGFAASVHFRGVPHLQIPTTLLAMIDASIGGKTGVNSRYGKNLIGTFHLPDAVLSDIGTLKTLEPREISAGLFEAVKQAALSGSGELVRLRGFIAEHPAASFCERFGAGAFVDRLISLVADQVAFKSGVVSGDASEDPRKTDKGSRKILNFGHTIGHALEKVTGYGYFTHGEAVGYGMLAAAEISKRLEICPIDSIDLLNDVVRSVGVLPDASHIAADDIIRAIQYDKKSGADSVTWILLENIGKPLIYSGQNIPPSVIKESIERIISR